MIYDAYDIDTIHPTLLKHMYPINPHYWNVDMWWFENIYHIEMHNLQHKRIWIWVGYKINVNYKDLVCDNGKITQYLFDNITFEKNDPTVKYLSQCNLSCTFSNIFWLTR